MAESKKEKPRSQKPIKLDDLIPLDDVTGGRKTVFGSPPPVGLAEVGERGRKRRSGGGDGKSG